VKRILVAVDGSEPSLHAVRMAAEMAKRYEATLTLVYVSPPILLSPYTYAEAIAEIEKKDREYGEKMLKDAAALAQGEGAKADTLTMVGNPADLIADTALDPAIGLVVVGNKGRGAVSRVLLGSVADRLVHISKKPVLVVR